MRTKAPHWKENLTNMKSEILSFCAVSGVEIGYRWGKSVGHGMKSTSMYTYNNRIITVEKDHCIHLLTPQVHH